MKRDLIYIFDKLNFQGQAFGEVQTNFNMSNVIDGTKDSMRVIVWSWQESEIEPFTILFHKKTMTWWIISHDKVERRLNDDNYYWVHNLDLLGAVELLNARDLTDCGFNDNKYTIGTFIERLFALSTFEYSLEIDTTSVDLDKKVDFIKTYENYTLLSALREFLDAYNCCAKLNFDFEDNDDILTITKAHLSIVSKTGTQDNIISMDSFNDLRETKTLDKNSFGSCVISNADNVMSCVDKTYPSIGGVKASSESNIIQAKNAVIRLPSKVYKGNWLAIVGSVAPVEFDGVIGNQEYNENPNGVKMNILDMESFNKSLDTLLEEIQIIDYNQYHNTPQGEGVFYEPFAEALDNARLSLYEKILKASTVKLYDGNKLVPYYGANNDQIGTTIIEKGDNVPYLVKVDYLSQGDDDEELIFCDKETKSKLEEPWKAICWERGSNLITGFEGFEPKQGRTATIEITNFLYTDLQIDAGKNPNEQYVFFSFENDYGNITIKTPHDRDYVIHFIGKYNGYENYAQWIVNYIPMSDIKIKVDNQVSKKDIQLYNQNGKLTDNFALSRLINSYAREISSDNITKYSYYYDYNDVPKVGQLVQKDNDYYVINNVSITFHQNEDNNLYNDYVYYHTLYTIYSVENHTISFNGSISGNTLTLNTQHEIYDDFAYLLECEITMSKNIAVKSLMVNPNTNIRDYGIPQNFNVKRKQVYRDYYELTYDRLSDSDTNYRFPVNEIFLFAHTPNTIIDLTCVMRIDYQKSINGSMSWYYQLETTNYYLNKMFYIMLDFNDNNIIGYGSQNVWSGFVISRIFNGLTDTLNTPISYVDDSGEFKGIDIYYCTNSQLTTIYQNYQNSQVGGDSYTGSLYNYSVFIPQEIYDSAKTRNKIRINENNYNKDALEVPVFEYACQCGDSNDVVFGDNVLRQYSSDYIYFYDYVVGDNINENNAKDTSKVIATTSPLGWRLYNGAGISSSQGTGNTYKLNIKLYAYYQYWLEDGSWTRPGTQISFQSNKDYAFFRHAYNLRTGEEIVDLLFIAKKVPSDKITNNNLILEINHYKL